ncbi:MAG TPA: Gfo/Idh/MocA family oxidoreductase [Pirellulaceae bacterium]|jgi:predicted dehydrogenase|nr:Gfo/Idh/MocA family oxidoreductase [Pirellulaceae bacterium]
MSTIRVGIVGLGANTRLRHVPGLRDCRDVEITSVCNRSEASTQKAASEFQIPKTFERWQDLVADDDIDAVVIGTWPYLHCEVTLAALAAGKHVLTEARMARNSSEARRMFAASEEHPELVVQIVPSPFGLRAHRVMNRLLSAGYLGELREAVVLGINDSVADPATPLHWRQDAILSGLNMLALGIMHETLVRWTPNPTRVLAQSNTFTPMRLDPGTDELCEVETPDSVRVLTEIPGGAQGLYHLSGALHFGPAMQIQLYGSQGTLKYQFVPDDVLSGAQKGESELREILIAQEEAGGWRVEEEFIGAIREEGPVEFTDFSRGLDYMAFTEAASRSAIEGRPIDLIER